MRLKVLPYVTVEVDERVRLRLRTVAERLRLNVRAHLLSAADDVDTAGERVRDRVGAAVTRVDGAVGRVADKLGPAESYSSEAKTRHTDASARVEAS